MNRHWGNQKPPPGVMPKNPNLIGCWTFNENGGGTAYDLSGYNNHGTLTNMANPATNISGWGAGRFGTALNFDDSDDHVAIPIGNFATLTKGTIIACVNIKSTDSAIFTVAKGSVTNVLSQFLYRSTSSFGFSVISGSSTLIYRQTITTFSLNTWYNVVITQDGTGVRIYVNGIEYATEAVGTEVGSVSAFYNSLSGLTTANMGAVLDSTPTYGGSIIDHVFFFNKALTPQEVQEYYIYPFKDFLKSTIYFVPSDVVAKPYYYYAQVG